MAIPQPSSARNKRTWTAVTTPQGFRTRFRQFFEILIGWRTAFRPFLREFAAQVLWLSVLAAAFRGIGPLASLTENAILITAGLGAFVLLAARTLWRANDLSSSLRVGCFAFAVACAIYALGCSPTVELRGAVVATLFLLGVLASGTKTHLRASCWAASTALVLAAILLISVFPSLSVFATDSFVSWTSACGRLWFSKPTPTGPSAGGGFPLVCTFALMTSAWILRLASPLRLAACLSLGLIASAFVLRHEYSGAVISHGPAAMALLANLETIMFSAVVCAIVLGRARNGTIPGGLSKYLVGTISCLIFVSLFVAAQKSASPRSPRPSRIWLWGRDGTYSALDATTMNLPAFVDWRRPSTNYGLANGGFFGMLPEYMRLLGHKTEIGDTNLQSLSLSRCDMLVIINPLHDWPPEDCSKVEEFVRSGGALLVLGDHTDFLGSQACLNRILEFTGIRFNFDSGYPFRKSWRDCISMGQDAITATIRDEVQLQISIGATLQVKAPAQPVVRGTYGFGDLGNYANTNGANLGNYTFELGETLGDVVLVAAERHGKGRVLVFGDTSSLQNLALARSFYPFTQRCLGWLLGPSVITLAGVWLLPLGVIAAFLCWRCVPLGLVVIGIACAGAGLACRHAHLGHPAYPGRASAGRAMAWLPTCVAPDDATKDPHLGGSQAVANCAARAGYLPMFVDRIVPAEAAPGDLLFLTNPAKPMTRAETTSVLRFIERGGIVILNTSFQGQRACQPMLDCFGMRLADIPLGPVPVNLTDTNAPQFVEAWPIAEITNQTARAKAHVDARWKVLYDYHGLPVVASADIGKGCLVLIGDGRFFNEENLESAFAYRYGNVTFLQRLLETTSKRRKENLHAGTSAN